MSGFDRTKGAGGSCIIATTGEIVAESTTEEDELIAADCGLEQCN